MKIIVFVTFVALSGVVAAQETGTNGNTAITPKFDLPDSNFISSGSIKLIWKIPDSSLAMNDYIFQLQQSHDADFDSLITRYTGPDLASYTSGLKNGVFHYRVRAMLGSDTSAWSAPIVVTVEHHSLQLAFILFGLGAIVFLATVFVVVHGVRNQEIIEPEPETRQGG